MATSRPLNKKRAADGAPVTNRLVIVGSGDEGPSLSDRAYRLIRERIISLKLKPGALIEEMKLMAELRIGRTPIREALRRLAWENLVRIAPRRGMFVGDINIADLAHISETRIGLEGHAARVAADRATNEQRAGMRQVLKDLRDLKQSDDDRWLIRVDQAVHLQMYQATQNPFLAQTLEQYYSLSLRIWFLALERVGRLDDAVQEHQNLLLAVLDGDADRAEQAIRHHIISFQEEMKQIL